MYNYFNFNGAQVNDLALVTKIEKPYIPETSISSLNIPSRDGEVFNGMKYNTIKIPISLAIIGTDEEDYKARVKVLKDLFSIRKEVPIGFTEYTSIYGILSTEFKVEQKNANTGYADIEIICTNPYTYSDYTITYDGGNTVNVGQKGGVATYPLISIGVTKDTHFVQVQNNSTREKLLIGNYEDITKPVSVSESSTIIHDTCQNMSALNIAGANIDANRSAGGTFSLSTSGEGYILGDMGSGSTAYKGACGRIPLPKELDEFEIKVSIFADSTGKNGDPNYFDPESQERKEEVKTGSKITYYVVNCTGLNYRTGPGTNYPSKGTLPKGYEIREGYTIADGWCKFPYKTKTYYCSAKYLTKMTQDNTTSTYKTYYIENVKVLPDGEQKVSAQRAILDAPGGKIVGYVPYGEIIRVLLKPYNTYDNNNNIKDTFYYMWKPYTNSKGEKVQGYIHKKVVVRSINNTTYTTDYANDTNYADDKTGTGEIYGFDVNGSQLFKMSLFDDNAYFEYTQPEIRVGNTIVLKDDVKAPTPRHRDVADSNGVTTGYWLGRQYGSWTEGTTCLSLARKKTGSNYVWHAEAYKIKNGVVTKQLYRKNNRSTDFPTNKLSYLAIYIGTSASSMAKCAGIAIQDILVTSSDKESTGTPCNITYFKAGDVIDIDCENCNCYVNRQLRNDLVDIGSSFFAINPGYTGISLYSDDKDASLSVTVREKWMGVIDDTMKSATKVETKSLYVKPYEIE